jgi:flagellar biosynthetic protein FliP
LILMVVIASPAFGAPDRKDGDRSSAVQANGPLEVAAPAPASETKPMPTNSSLWSLTAEDFRGLKGVVLIGAVSLAPAVVLMFTSFVRINIVLILLRQALGSPQVPGNQVLSALAVLLTLLVMRPVGESVYHRAVEPYAAGKCSAVEAWTAGSAPVKAFMIDQIKRTNHAGYLWDLYDFAEPPGPGRVEPSFADEFPLRVVAPAFLLSELTTALMIGFVIYLPFLVVDLVVSAVLSAMGLFMLPPSLVALPLKLVVFALADGWLLVATALLRTFAV